MILTPKKLIPFVATILAACTQSNDVVEMKPVHPLPNQYSFNPSEPYTINDFNKKSIEPIITTKGDSLITGKPVPIQGHVSNSDSLELPVLIKNVNRNVVELNDNKNFECKVLPATEIENSSLLVKSFIAQPDSNYYVNNVGDTVICGVPVKIKGNSRIVNNLKESEAKEPRIKDNAQFDIRYIDASEGLSSSNVFKMAKDKDGFIWIATDGEGICRYNGLSFLKLTTQNGLVHDRAICIFADSRNVIWIGTYGGLSKFDGTTFTNYTEREGLAANTIRSITEDHEGNIWFGSYGGVTKYNPKTDEFLHLTNRNGLPGNTVMSVREDTDHNMWFGIWGSGACKFDGKNFTTYGKESGLSSSAIYSITPTKKGGVWLGTYGGGAYYISGNSCTSLSAANGLSNNYVLDILEDSEGNFWFNTQNGTNVFDGSSISLFNETNGLSFDNCWSLLEDDAGNIWIGTSGGGISIYNPSGFRNYISQEGLKGNFVFSTYEDNNGLLWYGTDQGMIGNFNGKQFETFVLNENFGSMQVNAITQDAKGNYWFSTYGAGAFKYDGTNFYHYSTRQGLSSNYVNDIYLDSKNNLWFSLDAGGGVCKMSESDSGTTTFTRYSEEEGLGNQIAISVIEKEPGVYWVATYGGGLNLIDENSNTITRYTEKEGLSNNTIFCLHRDYHNNLWIGTYGGGINYLSGDSLKVITTQHGITSNSIWSFTETDEHEIWVATESGLNRIEIASLENNANWKSPITYTKIDGLKNLNFSRGGHTYSKDKKLWFGNGDNLLSYDLQSNHKKTDAPKVFITGMDINEKWVDFKNDSGTYQNQIQWESVPNFCNYPVKGELPYSMNHLSFHFVALDWRAPHKLMFSYQLIGQNHQWSEPSHLTKADFRNLDYGDYTFNLRAIGENGVWSEMVSYQFVIRPPWWHTWWFRVILFFVCILILFLLYRSRTAVLRARQKQLEKMVEERTAEAIAEKNEAHKQKQIAEKQKEIVEEKHREITDSINYAERIQRSFLATKELLDENLKDYFVFFQPKDVVSGDFYWATKLSNGNFVLVTADSTGHGVPGAIMSIANIACLKESVTKGFTEPHEILNETRKLVIDYLKNDGSTEGGKDGMDASLVSFDFQHKKLIFAAANNPVWIVRPSTGLGLGEIIEFVPDKMPVGKHDKQDIPFKSNQVELKSGDLVYTLTDGLPDQFGGEKGKKFMYKKLKELLISIAHEPMEMQKKKLNKAFFDWKGDLEQVDDVCVIGVRV
jgi:ligand-binding sensor domain-containing protein/serine phosphatase RsbU (regulator of sigma subunit)